MADISADLAGMDAAPPPPAKPAEKPAAASPKPGEVKPPETPPAKPEDTPPPAAPETPPKPVRAAELRTAYENLKKEKAEWHSKTQQLEAKVKELETASPEALKPLQEKLTAIEARNKELEQHIAFVDYSKSREFQEKYETPYLEAWNQAVGDFEQLSVKVITGKDDLGEPVFGARKATADDLLMLANLPLSEMDEKAEEMFGRSASRVIGHVEKIRDLARSREKALHDAQKKASDRITETQTQTKAQQQALAKAFDDEVKAFTGKYPDMFGPKDDDKEGNALLERGFAEADRMFKPTDATRPKTVQEAVALHARIRVKAANHDRLALRLKRMSAELDEVKKSLAAYEDSEPAAGKGGEAGAAQNLDPMSQVEAELRALDK